MSLKVIDGARLVDAANNACDIVPLDRTDATTNSTGVDMSGHEEFLVVAMIGLLDASHGLTIAIQESDEAAANFTNITTPQNTVTTMANNTTRVWSVDWRHPDRKRYARIQGIDDATNSALWGAQSIRAKPTSGPVTVDTDVIECKG